MIANYISFETIRALHFEVAYMFGASLMRYELHKCGPGGSMDPLVQWTSLGSNGPPLPGSMDRPGSMDLRGSMVGPPDSMDTPLAQWTPLVQWKPWVQWIP